MTVPCDKLVAAHLKSREISQTQNHASPRQRALKSELWHPPAMIRGSALLTLSFVLLSCGDPEGDPPVDPVMQDMCGDIRTGQSEQMIYYGKPAPTNVPLTAGQIMAVVSLGGCSGTVIADEWVASARHCGLSVGQRVCVGEFRSDSVCTTAIEAYDHPEVDYALLRVETPFSELVPALTPIPVMTEPLTQDWVGTLISAAGFGQQEDGSSNQREFADETLVEISSSAFVIDGMGVNGVCYGDSGGPTFGQLPDGSVRHLGALQGGDPSCVDQDNYTRSDAILAWIEGYTGPTVVNPSNPCGRIPPEGQCTGLQLTQCNRGQLEVTQCDGYCDYDPDNGRYRCYDEDPCEGLTRVGECDGEVARWCESGRPRERDCAACGQICSGVAQVGVYCVDRP